MDLCPCNSTQEFAACCGPLLDQSRSAASAEELMRARYCAYTRGDVSYILETIHPEKRGEHTESSIRKWSSESEWLGLDLLSAEEKGDDGHVEFTAHYRNEDGEPVTHHERSHFIRLDSRWYFYDGVPVEARPVVRENPKVGRNDPCPCGSGRKFKKCCGEISP